MDRRRRRWLKTSAAVGAGAIATGTLSAQAQGRSDVLFAREGSFIPVLGTSQQFQVRRIYCVGRNYAAHVREMGGDPDREAPFFFLKPADAVVETGAAIPYPLDTSDLHHEIELVVAIGRGGSEIPVDQALEHVFGYAVGIDLTRRDRQVAARDKGRPWDLGKAFDRSAPLGPIHRVGAVGHPERARIWLEVNGQPRQDSDLRNLIWSVPEIIAVLSRSWELRPGDLIFTGTPEGVGPMEPGAKVRVEVPGIGALENTVRQDKP